MKETYVQMKRRHKRELNSIPKFFAFNRKQYEENRLASGIPEEEVTSLGIMGGYCRKADIAKLEEISKRHVAELEEAYKDDDFLYKAVLYNLNNYEFCVTEDWTDVLEELGFGYGEVFENERMRRIFEKAEVDYMERVYG